MKTATAPAKARAAVIAVFLFSFFSALLFMPEEPRAAGKPRRSQEQPLFIGAEDFFESLNDFAHSRVGFDRADDKRNKVFVI